MAYFCQSGQSECYQLTFKFYVFFSGLGFRAVEALAACLKLSMFYQMQLPYPRASDAAEKT